MPTAVAMPKLGLLMTEGVVVKWLKNDGALVKKGEPIVAIMTKKITYQVIATADGNLRQVARAEQTVLIGEPLAFILADGETLVEESAPRSGPTAPSGRPPASSHPDASVSSEQFIPATPWARQLARERGIDLALLQGSGSDGCIMGRDVSRFAQEHPSLLHKEPSPPGDSPAHSRTIPLKGMRKVIAQRMTESHQTMAQATLTSEIDLTEVVKFQKRSKSPVTCNDLIVKAVALALREHSELNATLIGEEIQLLDEIHIGLTVGLKDGVLVPVIRNADRQTLAGIARETRRLLASAASGVLTVDDVTGSTFTITDLGVYGVDFFVPIINPPEAATLGLGRLNEKRMLYHNKMAKRSTMMFCLSFDHRIVDGPPAAAFLQTIAQLLAKPKSLLD